MKKKWQNLSLCHILTPMYTAPCAYSPNQFFFVFKCLWAKRSEETLKVPAGSEWELSCPHILLLILLHPTNCCIFIISLDSVSLFITRMLQFFILHWQLATGNAGCYFVQSSQAHSFPSITMFCLLYFVLGVVECHPWKDVHWATIE